MLLSYRREGPLGVRGMLHVPSSRRHAAVRMASATLDHCSTMGSIVTFHPVPPNRCSIRRELLARFRGEQTLSRMRRAGLHAPGPLSLGTRVYIDELFAWAITIGAHTRIAHDVRIIAHDAAVKHLTGYTEVRPVRIGEYCYIGAGALILPGAIIGPGAVIGAGAIVRGAIPAEVIAAGNPARIIKGVQDLRARHLSAQSTSTLFDKRPVDGTTALEQQQMQDALASDGRLYVR